MFKASKFVQFCKAMVGMPYWYGTCVYPCTNDLLARKEDQYPSHYGDSRTKKYEQNIKDRKVCADCIGLIKGFFWTNGGEGVLEYVNGGEEYESEYGGNGCPDKGANGMLTWLKSKGCANGTIDTLPEVPGILVFKSGHVGVYVGNGKVVEAQGFSWGIVETKVAKRPWKEWAYLPDDLLSYDDSCAESLPDVPTTPVEPPKPEKTDYKLGERTLKHISPDMRGDDVKELQNKLNEAGYDCGKVDGIFGTKTENAVKAFQTAMNLEVDGKFGKKSFAALSALSDTQDEPERDETKYEIYVVQKGDSLWNLARKFLGAGSRYTRIMELNGLTSIMIRDGDVLKIPEKT